MERDVEIGRKCQQYETANNKKQQPSINVCIPTRNAPIIFKRAIERNLTYLRSYRVGAHLKANLPIRLHKCCIYDHFTSLHGTTELSPSQGFEIINLKTIRTIYKNLLKLVK